MRKAYNPHERCGRVTAYSPKGSGQIVGQDDTPYYFEVKDWTEKKHIPTPGTEVIFTPAPGRVAKTIRMNSIDLHQKIGFGGLLLTFFQGWKF